MSKTKRSWRRFPRLRQSRVNPAVDGCCSANPNPSFGVEPLEARFLLSGVTLITHGFNGGVDGWVAAMADAIEARADADADFIRYTITAVDSDDESGGPILVLKTAQSGGNIATEELDDPEIVVLLDWSNMAGELRINDEDITLGGFHRSTVDVAEAVVAALVDDPAAWGLPSFLPELPLHLIGHSRGASLVSEMARLLGERGIWVDQVTTLDPHPVDGTHDQ